MAKNDAATIHTTVRAPLEKVWNYWNEPSWIKQWAFAADDWEVLAASNDLKAGGRLIVTMAAKDGSYKFDYTGLYEQVNPFALIVLVLDDGRKVRVEFEAKDGVVEVNETFDLEMENSREMQVNGWQAILDNFKKVVERNEKIQMD